MYDMTVMSKSGSHGSCRRSLIVVSLILVVVLFSSLLASRVLVADDGFAHVNTEIELRDTVNSVGGPLVHVSNEVELRNAVNSAENGVHIDITLTKDVSLTSTLSIPARADITLKSVAGRSGFFKLVGLDGQNVITVYRGGQLTLDGVIVTHKAGSTGRGIWVDSYGVLIMVDGEISGNTDYNGAGIYVEGDGSFSMLGGIITSNIATPGMGGGVQNQGTFIMSGGNIVGNAAMFGGGVFNGGDFSLLGGVISDNTSSKDVCDGCVGHSKSLGWCVTETLTRLGLRCLIWSHSKSLGWCATETPVHYPHSFGWSGGEVSGDEVVSGGGVCMYSGSFIMSGGVISGNDAISGGGVCIWGGSFELSGGVISGNTAVLGWGGGVYNYNGAFNRIGGEISNNVADISNDVHQKLNE
jgi:hypothetical protein